MTIHRIHSLLRIAGRLVGETAVYLRPGMPTEHVPVSTDRSAVLGRDRAF